MAFLMWLAEELYDSVCDILGALKNGSYYRESVHDDRNFPPPNTFDSAPHGGGD
jgi:hypothetical protein